MQHDGRVGFRSRFVLEVLFATVYYSMQCPFTQLSPAAVNIDFVGVSFFFFAVRGCRVVLCLGLVEWACPYPCTVHL